MTPPVRGRRFIAIDRAIGPVAAAAVLDETGKLKDIRRFIRPSRRRMSLVPRRHSKKIVEKFHTDIIVVGNGMASRETEEVVANFIKKNGGYDIQYTIVNEAGRKVGLLRLQTGDRGISGSGC